MKSGSSICSSRHIKQKKQVIETVGAHATAQLTVTASPGTDKIPVDQRRKIPQVNVWELTVAIAGPIRAVRH
jgi:hypothetical protein